MGRAELWTIDTRAVQVVDSDTDTNSPSAGEAPYILVIRGMLRGSYAQLTI